MTQDKDRAAFEAWLRIKPCGAAHDFAWEAWQARAALQSQYREDLHIPPRRDYVANITDGCVHVAYREGYVEGWNDCRQEAIDHARRVEGDGM